MKKVQSLVVWICKKFTSEQITNLMEELSLVLEDKYSDLKPKDAFKEKHPKYRDFSADPLAPLDYSKFERSKKNVTSKK